ncbi:DEAD/DEAH box helicase [Paenibacillus radicis (ex Gao et al. 2016)]|uniref:ATP-dependent DNA helicase n=1 Tax=Paenibacillus radicis (ex Gao et al. 2016) TaxID=1737354 RepID=A0A917M2M6_9BACL|nr:DEAD/DEAH box helicase [Paenibacillus radicis (ex Gao et al. 2016)]GGG71137.1 ATP-dependent DNA helicase [Paenibacillus radicis (ex Gao et al. 2016)]
MPNSSMKAFHPAIAEWFHSSFGEETDVQRQAWRSIGAGEHTLIAAPTGSGKTLAALLSCLDSVVKSKINGFTETGVRILYITPLKALNNDIFDHLIRFVEEIDAAAGAAELEWPGIRCAVRTGDTTSSQRAAMLRKPPEVLITTPESLYILLTSEKGRRLLQTAEYAIVDEIHQLAADKRGSHLSLSLERLERLSGRRVQRIGVSATQKPMERVARFLGGWSAEEFAGGNNSSEPHPLGYSPRPVTIIESLMRKRMAVLATMPDHKQPMPTRESVWFPLLDRLFALMAECRSVLLFVNSRRLCERLCLRLNDHAGYEFARAHHGSMAKERRLEVEQQLKAGELRCIVATSSLELGIDVGHVDLVIQLDSPLDSAAGIQRVGRAGHAVGSVSRGAIVARNRGVLPEIAVLSKLITEREIEPIEIASDRLDVLSQQTVSIVAAENLTLDQLHRLIAGSDSYRTFTKERLEDMVKVLSGMYPFAKPLIDWNRATGLLSKRGSTSVAALTGAGTIPSSSAYPVHHVDSRVHLGELDEEFVQESKVGDVFQLGTNAWMIRRIDKDRIYVAEATNSFSEIPFWRNEGPGRSYALGQQVGSFLAELQSRLGLSYEPGKEQSQPNGISDDSLTEKQDQDVIDWLNNEYYLDDYTADQLISLVRSQLAFSELPTDRRIVIEHYRDVMNQTHVILHNPFGRRVNRTWLLAIERQFEQLLPYRLYGNAKDNGIEFVLPEWDESWLQAIWHVVPENVESLLMEGITGSPLLAIAFRHIAETSLLLSRSFTRTPLWQKRLRSEELLREALPYADRFPYLTEAVKECLHHYLDLDRLRELLGQIRSGQIEVVVRETSFPSTLATQFLSDYVNMRVYEGDGLDAAIQMQLMSVSKDLAGRLFGDDAVRKSIPEQVLEMERKRLEEEHERMAGPEDLYRLLKSRGDLSMAELAKIAGEKTGEWSDVLLQSDLVIRLEFGDRLQGNSDTERWICSDEAEVYAEFPDSSTSAVFIIGRYAEQVLSFTEVELCERYPILDLQTARRWVDELREQGVIVQAPFAGSAEERLWTGRRAASRIVKLSIGEARKVTAPVLPMRWCAQIALQQHALQGTQLRGSEGLRAVIEKLQGLYFPLSLWETVIFPSRLADYRKEELDLLCATGEVLWLGLKGSGEKEGKVAFFLTENKPLYEPYVQAGQMRETSHPKLLESLRVNGASFLTRLSRDAGQLPTETLAELLELAWAGQASNDQFAPLRLTTAKKGKDWARSGSGLGRWYWTGSLLEDKSVSGHDLESGSADNEPSPAYWIRHLLDGYGIVTKELVAALTPYSWEHLLPVLRKLEEWGTITRGIFIEGAMTMQFTTPELAQTIRQPLIQAGSPPITLLSAVDPANPFGLLIDWPEKEGCAFARKPGNYLAFKGEQLLYWMEGNGKRVFTFDSSANQRAAAGKSGETAALQDMQAVFGELLRRQKLTKLVIDKWNGEEAVASEAGKRLEQLGAERDRKSLVLWLSQFNTKSNPALEEGE